MLLPTIGRILRLASIAICAIAVLYFVSFALDQTSSASSHQQAELNGTEAESAAAKKSASRKSGASQAVDEAFAKLASPFAGVVSSSGSAWTLHIVDTLLVLLVYGFGLGFLARLLRLSPG